jgi:hypothetical protein
LDPVLPATPTSVLDEESDWDESEDDCDLDPVLP